MSQQTLEYTCIRQWHSLDADSGFESWFETLPLVLQGDNVSNAFLLFMIVHMDDITANRRSLPKSTFRWAYVDCALQLVLQRKDEILERAQNLSTANALCLARDSRSGYPGAGLPLLAHSGK